MNFGRWLINTVSDSRPDFYWIMKGSLGPSKILDISMTVFWIWIDDESRVLQDVWLSFLAISSEILT